MWPLLEVVLQTASAKCSVSHLINPINLINPFNNSKAITVKFNKINLYLRLHISQKTGKRLYNGTEAKVLLMLCHYAIRNDPKTSKTEKLIKGIISVSVHCAQMLPSQTERNDRLNSGLVITSGQTPIVVNRNSTRWCA